MKTEISSKKITSYFLSSAQPGFKYTPLSFGQERLWYIDQLQGSVQYHIPVVLRLKGMLKKDALAYALQYIVNRHEVLRTVIREQERSPYQCIQDKDRWQLGIIEGSEYKDNPQALQYYIQQLISKPFKLSKDHMLRADLIML